MESDHRTTQSHALLCDDPVLHLLLTLEGTKPGFAVRIPATAEISDDLPNVLYVLMRGLFMRLYLVTRLYLLTRTYVMVEPCSDADAFVHEVGNASNLLNSSGATLLEMVFTV